MSIGVFPSRFNILVPLKQGRTLAYNSMSEAMAVWEEAESADFRRFSSSGLNTAGSDTSGSKAFVDAAGEDAAGDFLYGGFLVGEGVDELAILRRNYEGARNDSSTMVLTIAPTLMCNFGCDYCFQGKNKPAGVMSSEVQDAVIQHIERSAAKIKRLHVAWYGGEPLLAGAVIGSLSRRILAICEENQVVYDSMIVTNGYGLTPENISLLETCRVTAAQITLDGAAAFHDVRRSLLGGQETFSRILKNLKRVLSETRIQISVRVNIDARNRDSIHGLLEYLAEQGFGYRKTFSVYFAPVEAITDGCHSVASLCMTKSEHGELETELTRTAYKLGLAPLPYPPRYRGICGAVRPGGLVILPSGDLHKCWDTVSMPEHKVGTIYQAELLEGDKRALRWAQWTPFDNNICTSCRILPNCVGSCAHKFLNAEQTLGEAASLPCPSWKFNMRERLLLMAEGTGALSKDDLPDQMEPDRLHIGSAPGWAERYAAHAVARQAAAGLVSIKVAHP